MKKTGRIVLEESIIGLVLIYRGAEIDSRGKPMEKYAKYRLSSDVETGLYIIDKIENINPN